MILTDAALVITFFVLSLIFTVQYYKRVEIERPPFGHFNWRDLILALAFIVGAPFGYLALPQWGATILFALIFLTLLNLSTSQVIEEYSVVRVLFLVAVLGVQYVVYNRFNSFMLSNVLALIIFMCVGPVFVKNGLQPKEVAFFGTALIVYDVIATIGSGFMMQFVEKMLSQPYFLGFVASDFLVGGGDVVLSSIFVATTIKYKGLKQGYILVTALTVPIVVIALIYHFGGYLVPVPYLIIAAPVYLFFYYVVFK
ncbi:MAG: hypothetical protein PVF58_05880 [Candidatus Methanofastidiosia archaeon]|jgi:hypothetical protein